VTFVIDNEVSMRLALAHTAFGRGVAQTHPEECDRVDWRSTLRYAATVKRRRECDIVRLVALRRWGGTAFGTARLVEFALSADDASLFRPVGPFHHGGDGKTSV
jgi:hypothetical protein